ncbi:MAG: ester cyclase [Desulfobacterales bacterium]|nr:ester cyclase [Desulfobacterales bacterium]
MRRKASGVILSLVLVLTFWMNAWAGEPRAKVREFLETTVVRSYFSEALDAKQSDLIFSIFTEDAKQHFNGYLNLTGVDQIYQNTVMANRIFSQFHTDIHDITADGEKVVAHVTHTAVCIDSTAPGFPGGPIYLPTRVDPILLQGQTIQWEAMARFKFNKRLKIEEEWIVRDELNILLMSGTLTFTDF